MIINKKQMTPAIVLAAHTSGLGVIRSLGQMGVPIYAVTYERINMGHKSRYVKEYFNSPHPDKNPDKFIEFVLEIGKNLDGSILFPASDPTLVAVSKNKERLSSSFELAFPDWPSINKIINKNIAYSIAERLEIPIPQTVLLENEMSFNTVKDKFVFPCIVKPVQSHKYYDIFKRKMAIVQSLDELREKYYECKEFDLDVTVQELIPGDVSLSTHYNSLFYNGRVIQEFAADKIRMTDNSFGVPTVVKSRNNVDQIADYSKKLLNEIGFYGYSCIEFKFDQRDGHYKFLEVNGRYNRSSLLCLKAGINFPWIEYNIRMNNKISVNTSYKKEIYWIDEFKDLQSNVKKILSRKLKISSFIKPYFCSHTFAVFSFRDPLPFIKRMIDGTLLLMHLILKGVTKQGKDK